MKTEVIVNRFHLGVLNNIATAVVISLPWVDASRRLGANAVAFYGCYAVLSVIIGMVLWLRKRPVVVNVIFAALLPFLVAVFSYLIITIPWVEKNATAMNFISLLGVSLFYPYFLIWGPIISAINAATEYLYQRFSSKAKAVANSGVA